MAPKCIQTRRGASLDLHASPSSHRALLSVLRRLDLSWFHQQTQGQMLQACITQYAGLWSYEFSWSHFIALWSLLKGEIHLLILLRCVVSSHHDIYFSHLSCLIIFQKPANSLPTTHFIGPNWSNNASEKVVRSIKGSAIWPHVSDSYGYYLELDIRASPTRIACNGA